MKVVFASNNSGKIQEVQALLKNLTIELIPQSLLGVDEAEEIHHTFVENALLKARHAAKLTGLPAIADDSGIIVKALNGAPGVYSARYAGEPSNAKNNINKLLKEMQHVKKQDRQAAFYSVLVYISHADDPTPLICDAYWHGEILEAPTGENGFGYDPVFYDDKQNASAAQLPLEVKNRISHRGQALQLLLKKLPEKLCSHSQ